MTKKISIFFCLALLAGGLSAMNEQKKYSFAADYQTLITYEQMKGHDEKFALLGAAFLIELDGEERLFLDLKNHAFYSPTAEDVNKAGAFWAGKRDVYVLSLGSYSSEETVANIDEIAWDKYFSKLNQLYLSGYKITPKSFKVLGDNCCSSLKVLYLTDCVLSKESIQSIEWKEFKNLKFLSLTSLENEVHFEKTDKNDEKIIKSIFNSCPKLKKIKVSGVDGCFTYNRENLLT